MARVSVIIPTYNRASFIQEAINSVIAQSFEEYELIVVDDGSTDGTSKIIKNKYGEKVCYYWQENQGESIARNKGIQLAKSKYIAFLDSDDIWLPRKLEVQVQLLDENQDIGMTFSQAMLINENGKLIDDRIIGQNLNEYELTFENLVLHNLISGSVSSSMIRKDILDGIGGFDPHLRYGEDWDLWLRILSVSKFGFIPIPLVQIRRHQDTQCYFPTINGNSKRLSDHLVILEKAFVNSQGSHTEQGKARAFSYQYAQAFLAEKSVNNDVNAMENLQLAFSNYPSILYNPDDFGQLIVDNGAILVRQDNLWDYPAAVGYVDRVFDDLNHVGITDKHFELIVRGKLFAMLGFLASENGDTVLARNFIILAIRNNPSWLLNRGVISILLKSIFGNPPIVQS